MDICKPNLYLTCRHCLLSILLWTRLAHLFTKLVINYGCGLLTANRVLMSCLCASVCVCLLVYKLNTKIMGQSRNLNIFKYMKNSLDEFNIGQCLIKVKISENLIFLHLPQHNLSYLGFGTWYKVMINYMCVLLLRLINVVNIIMLKL